MWRPEKTTASCKNIAVPKTAIAVCDKYNNLGKYKIRSRMKLIEEFYNAMVALGDELIKALSLKKHLDDLKTLIDGCNAAYDKRKAMKLKKLRATYNAKVALADAVSDAVGVVDKKEQG